LAAMILLSSTAFCRLGESPAECGIRYGSPTETQTDENGNQVLRFTKGQYEIFITFLNGKAGQIQYSHNDRDRVGIGSDLSGNEVETLLKANFAGQWEKVPTFSMSEHWQNSECSMFAEKRNIKQVLFVWTKEFQESQAAAQKAKENKALQGM